MKKTKEATAIPSTVPAHLKTRDQWVCWVSQETDAGQKKIPINVKTLKAALVNDPSTFSNYQDALQCYQKNPSRLAGIGFVLTEADDVIGIDLDHCIDTDTGIVQQWALNIIQDIDSYTEISPSGTGIHIFCRGDLKLNRNRKDNVEIYANGRYLTLTGRHLPETPSELCERPAEIKHLAEAIFNEPITKPTNIIPFVNAKEELEVVVRRVEESIYGKKFSSLAAGNWKIYGSQSEADMAFCGILARFTKDKVIIDEAYRKSGLFREKWDEVHGSQTYGDRTIDKALQGSESMEDVRAFEEAYIFEDDGIYEKTIKGNKKLCNFTACITETIIVADGDGFETHYAIEGKTEAGTPLPKITVSHEDFKSGKWLDREWAGDVILSPANNVVKHLATAISSHSRSAKQRIYRGIGWIEIDGKVYYITRSGGISMDGLSESIIVDQVEGDLNLYSLPAPPTGDNLRKANEASLEFFDFAKGELITPVFGIIHASVLSDLLPIDTAVFIYGRSGSKKSEVAAIAQSFFGKGFKRKTLPANWSSTDNAIERQMHITKDALLVIDEYRPSGVATSDTELRAKANKVFMGIGNRSARERSSVEGQLRKSNRPRCGVLVTGEEVPPTEAVRARMLILEVAPDDIVSSELSKMQQHAMDGIFAESMAGYIRHLASKWSHLEVEITAKIGAEQEYFRHALPRKGHDRVPDALAILAVGADLAFTYYQEAETITAEEKAEYMTKVRENLCAAGEKHGEFLIATDPATLFVEKINSVLQTKTHTLTRIIDGRSKFNEMDGKSTLGYVDREEGFVYLFSDQAYAAVNSICRSMNESMIVQQKTLSKQMANKGFVVRQDENSITCRKTIDGERKTGLYKMPISLFPAVNKKVDEDE